MSLLQNTVALLYAILFFISLCSFTFGAPTAVEVSKDNQQNMMVTLFQLFGIDNNNSDVREGKLKGRVKRNSGAGKFTDAAKMPPTKVMQLFMTFFSNLVTTDPVGGNHPMSKEHAKPVVQLFKQRIIAFFFPDIGDSHQE